MGLALGWREGSSRGGGRESIPDGVLSLRRLNTVAPKLCGLLLTERTPFLCAVMEKILAGAGNFINGVLVPLGCYNNSID